MEIMYWAVGFCVVLVAVFYAPGWVSEFINFARGKLCPLPNHSAKLRLKGLRLHYECTRCGHQWSLDRTRGKPDLKVVKAT